PGPVPVPEGRRKTGARAETLPPPRYDPPPRTSQGDHRPLGLSIRPRSLLERAVLYVLERPMHHVGVDVTQRGVLESSRQGPHDDESQTFPQFDGGAIGAHDEIELHGRETGPL